MPDLYGIPIGSWPQWILLLVVVAGFIKWAIPWKADEMRKLRAELKECEAECDQRISKVEARAKRLEADLWGEKRQRVTEQISFINIVLESVDNPALKTMLKTLESVQSSLQVQQIINGDVHRDAQNKQEKP